MIVINSADYVISELQNEIGKIPPVFLPIGNKHILKYQVAFLRDKYSDESIYVSLPQNYSLSKHEINILTELMVKPIFVKDNFTLGMALLYVLNSIGTYDGSIRLLHGDTLIKDLPEGDDFVCIGTTTNDYKWKNYKSFFDSNSVWAGFFSFSSITKFLTNLASVQGNFVEAVTTYNDEMSLSFVNVNEWYDVGHVNTYFTSRCTITTQRAFNSLRISDGVVWKSGEPTKKIEAEANWFDNIPSKLKRYIPQFIETGCCSDKPFYVTEFVSCLPLNELYVYGRNTVHYWSKIFDLIFGFMQAAKNSFPKDNLSLIHDVKIGSDSLFRDKTLSRLNDYSSKQNFELTSSVIYEGKILPSTINIANECIEKSLALPIVNTILHGDLCLSNIIYDSRSENIKVIDPRGLDFKNNFSIYGNQVYDISKLIHSIVGMYDFIIADLYELNYSEDNGWSLIFNEEQRYKDIQRNLMERKIIDKEVISMDMLIAPTILLFLSMIPLHFDKPNRQKAMLANAYRLYSMYMCKK
ncbi:MAG: hypothetical protein ACI4V7_10720 [Succinivibrionaceae bacterium]